MIYWHWRNFQCILAALLKPRIPDPTQAVTKIFFANPLDSDWGSVVSAGTFFTYTDAGRWELSIRAGFLRAALKNKWVVIMGGQKIIHRRPVKIFRSFSLTMQFVGWDNKWIYAAHVFRQGGDVKAVSFTKLGIRGRGKLVDPQLVFSAMGCPHAKAPPDWMLKHFADDVDVLNRTAELLVPSLAR